MKKINELLQDRKDKTEKLATIAVIIAELKKVYAEREDLTNKVEKARLALDAGYERLAVGGINSEALEVLRTKYEGLMFSADMVAKEKASLSDNLEEREQERKDMIGDIGNIDRQLWQIVLSSITSKIIKEVQPELQQALIAFSNVYGGLPHSALSLILSSAVIWVTDQPAPNQDEFDRIQRQLEEAYFGKPL